MEKIVFHSGIGTEGERQFTLGVGKAQGPTRRNPGSHVEILRVGGPR